jgi:hypothetical protein
MSLPFPITPSAQPSLRQVTCKTAKRRELHLAISLPKDLKLLKANPDAPSQGTALVNTACFKSPAKNMEVTIQTSDLQHEVSMEGYYSYMAELGRENIIEKRFIGDDPDVPDFLIEGTFRDGRTWITRRTG